MRDIQLNPALNSKQGVPDKIKEQHQGRGIMYSWVKLHYTRSLDNMESRNAHRSRDNWVFSRDSWGL